MPKNTVPVYSMKAESIGDTKSILYYVTEKKARELMRDGKANRVTNRKDPLKIQLLNLVRQDVDSPASLGFKEVQANVGIGSDAYVRSVRTKVEMWNAVSEPRWMANPEKPPFNDRPNFMPNERVMEST